MGNRCVITNKDNTRAIYQHWNGGLDSVEPLLQAAKDLGKGFDGLVELSSLVFDGEEVHPDEADYDNYDNGTYVIDDEFNIVKRQYAPTIEQNAHNTKHMLLFIKLTHMLGKDKEKEVQEIMEIVKSL